MESFSASLAFAIEKIKSLIERLPMRVWKAQGLISALLS
jgi:hypothetical protein